MRLHRIEQLFAGGMGGACRFAEWSGGPGAGERRVAGIFFSFGVKLVLQNCHYSPVYFGNVGIAYFKNVI